MGPRRGSYQPVVPADRPDAILPGARAEAYGRAKSIQIPIATNPRPAMARSGRGGIQPPRELPASTARAVDRHSAAADARSTPSLLIPGVAAKNNVASCVLSPNSARNTLTKTAT